MASFYLKNSFHLCIFSLIRINNLSIFWYSWWTSLKIAVSLSAGARDVEAGWEWRFYSQVGSLTWLSAGGLSFSSWFECPHSMTAGFPWASDLTENKKASSKPQASDCCTTHTWYSSCTTVWSGTTHIHLALFIRSELLDLIHSLFECSSATPLEGSSIKELVNMYWNHHVY